MVLIVTLIDTIKSHIQEIPEIYRKTAQAVTEVTRTTDHNSVIQGITKTYRKAAQAITEATESISHNRCSSPHRIPKRKQHHTAKETTKQKINDAYNRSYSLHHATNPHDNYNQ